MTEQWDRLYEVVTETRTIQERTVKLPPELVKTAIGKFLEDGQFDWVDSDGNPNESKCQTFIWPGNEDVDVQIKSDGGALVTMRYKT